VSAESTAHARARESDELPADHIGVSAVDQIAKHSLDRVLTQQGEEMRVLDLLQFGVLFGRRQFVETFQAF
jgi:hypothetical protein